jgi:hypothetical protein
MITITLITIAIVALICATAGRKYDHGIAVVQYAYGKTHHYKARRERETGKVQIYVREWMPAQPPGPEGVKVTFTKTEP